MFDDKKYAEQNKQIFISVVYLSKHKCQ